MQRIIKIEKYRNIGLEKPETLVLNHSMAKGELGDLIILIGANNSGKSNVLDALRAIGQGKLRDRDITTLSFSSEDRVPSVSFSVRDKDNYMYYNVGLNKQADVQIKLEDKKESPSVLDRQMLIDDMEAALNILSQHGIGNGPLRDLLAKVRLEETEITDALVDEVVKKINAAEVTFRSSYGRNNNFVNSMPADGYWRINRMVSSGSELDRANDYCQASRSYPLSFLIKRIPWTAIRFRQPRATSKTVFSSAHFSGRSESTPTKSTMRISSTRRSTTRRRYRRSKGNSTARSLP